MLKRFKAETITYTDIEGYLTLSKSFTKDKREDLLFAVHATNENKEFGIEQGAYLLCQLKQPEKSGQLVIDSEVIKTTRIYRVFRYIKKRGYSYLYNSTTKIIVDKKHKLFGVVDKIFNISKPIDLAQ